MSCPFCPIVEGFQAWRERRQKARAALNKQQQMPPAEPWQDVLRRRERWRQKAVDEGWQRVESLEDLRRAIPESWIRRPRGRWIK